MKQNQDYKNESLAALKGNWAPAVLCSLVMYVLAVALFGPMNFSQPDSLPDAGKIMVPTGTYMSLFFGGSLLMLLVYFPFAIGFYNAHKVLLVNGDNRLTQNSFRIGFDNWAHHVWGMFLMGLFIILWSFLLFIPGIIKAYSYGLTPYILAERPELGANQAIDESRRLMKGHKFDLFYLDLSFIGWYLLTIFTLGIGLLWVIPYHYTARAAFWEDIKANDPAWQA